MRRKLVLYLLFVLTSPAISQEKQLRCIQEFPDEQIDVKDNFLCNVIDFEIYRNCFYVPDAREGCIKVFDKSGVIKSMIGGKGNQRLQLIDPFKCAIDEKRGVIYCEDQSNACIAVFDCTGKLIRSIRVFDSVGDLMFFDDHLYVCSLNLASQTLFEVYDTSGRLVNTFGKLFHDARFVDRDIHYGYYLMNLESYNGYIYAFFPRFAIITIHSSEGHLVKSLKLEFLIGKKIDVMECSMCIDDNKFFVYARSRINGGKQEVLVVDFNGRLLQHFDVIDGVANTLMLRHKIGSRFYFADASNAKIKVFELRQKERGTLTEQSSLR